MPLSRAQLRIALPVIILLCQIFACPADASSDDEPLKSLIESVTTDAVALDSITRQILKKEIELDSLNQKFRLHTALTTKWRQRRVFLYSETNSCLTLSSLIEAVPQRYKIINAKNDATSAKIRKKARGKFACATELQLTGQCLSLGGDVFEMGLNYYNYRKLKGAGFDPKSYRVEAEILESEIDSLISERKKMLTETANLTGADLKAAQLEGQLIDDYRNIVLTTYADYHSATNRFWVLQNTSFLVDMAKNGSGAAGNIIGLTGNHLKHPRMQGGSGVMSLISGVIVLATPAVGRITSNVSAVAARRLVSKKMQNVETIDAAALEKHRRDFLSLVAESSGSKRKETTTANPRGYLEIASARINVFAREEKMLYDIEKGVARDRKLAHDNLVENIVFAGVVAPPRMTNGITQIIGGWRYYSDHTNANRLYLAGNTAYMAATGFNIFETARIELNAEIRFHDQAKNHNSTRDRIGARLKTLDEMKSAI
ncbi:MAG: hypothetical protein P4L53_15375 [Candidatus Obscuribacterales bacterium]|nr:hypothetical protein [Candidatus Obscuribacterales bacterium]